MNTLNDHFENSVYRQFSNEKTHFSIDCNKQHFIKKNRARERQMKGIEIVNMLSLF